MASGCPSWRTGIPCTVRIFLTQSLKNRAIRSSVLPCVPPMLCELAMYWVCDMYCCFNHDHSSSRWYSQPSELASAAPANVVAATAERKRAEDLWSWLKQQY